MITLLFAFLISQAQAETTGAVVSVNHSPNMMGCKNSYRIEIKSGTQLIHYKLAEELVDESKDLIGKNVVVETTKDFLDSASLCSPADLVTTIKESN